MWESTSLRWGGGGVWVDWILVGVDHSSSITVNCLFKKKKKQQQRTIFVHIIPVVFVTDARGLCARHDAAVVARGSGQEVLELVSAAAADTSSP